MNGLKAAFGEVAGLFVEDGALALAIIAVVVTAAVSTHLFPNYPSAAGGILLLGCLGALATNVARAARR